LVPSAHWRPCSPIPTKASGKSSAGHGKGCPRTRPRPPKPSRAADAELPDHLGHVLEVLDALDGDAARALARDKVLPALSKMRQAAAEHPYDGLLRAIQTCLETRFAAPAGGEKP
jgi:hypothetical protein